jgi:hypothetical protein
MSDLDLKFVEQFCNDKLYRPFMRKLRYLYFGLNHADDLFVLSNTEDIKFKYCEAVQTTGVVKVINAEMRDKINACFTAWGIDRSRPMLVYFGELMALLSKVSWKADKFTLTSTVYGTVVFNGAEFQDVMVARPCDTHFTLTQLQSYVDKYTKVFFERSIPSYALELPDAINPNKLQRIPISANDLYKANFLKASCYDLHVISLPGQDSILPKSLISKTLCFETGLRFWNDGYKESLNYGGYYTDADVSVCVIRDNVSLFPKLKLE